MIDKSIRQYYERGQLVKPKKGRPGYQGKTPKQDFSQEFVDLYKQGKYDNLDQAIKDADRYNAGEITNYEKIIGKNPIEDIYDRDYTAGEHYIPTPDETKDISPKSKTKTPIRQAEETPEKFESTAQRLKTEIEKAGGTDYADAIRRGETGIKEISKDPKFKSIREIGGKMADQALQQFATTEGDFTLKSAATGIGKRFVTNAIAKKIVGTGLLAGLGPIGWLIGSWLANKAVSKFTGAKDEGLGITGAADAFTGKLREPSSQAQYEADKELRVLENRRTDMLQRKEEGRNYSDKNLGDVTREIAKKKGLDILNPNEMRNIDKPIEQIKIEKGDETIPTSVATITRDVGLGDAGIAERIAAENRAEAQAAAQAESRAAASRAAAARAVERHTGASYSADPSSDGGYSGDPGGGTAGSPFYKGGRIDKALTGRNRDI